MCNITRFQTPPPPGCLCLRLQTIHCLFAKTLSCGCEGVFRGSFLVVWRNVLYVNSVGVGDVPIGEQSFPGDTVKI